jgi:PAS domain S-box-containing protein/putative nucleotidyltransferase with HDIG domain
LSDRSDAEKNKRNGPLSETDKRFQSLIEVSPVPIITLDPGGIVQLWNPAAERIFGWSGKEAIGRILPIVPQEKMDEFRALLDRTLQNETLTGVEVTRRRKDGSPVELIFNTSRLYDSEGNVSGVMAVYMDITERKLMETNLLLFRNLINLSNDLVFIVDPETGRFLDINDTACSSLGYRHDELLRMKVSDIASGIPEFSVWTTHVEELKKKGFMVLEDGVRRKNGATFPAEISVRYAPLDGRVYMVAVVRDISERKQAEECVLRITHDWEDTFNSITDMITVHDKDFNIIRANKAAEKLLGLPFLEVTKAKCYEYYHGTGCPPEGCPSCQCLKTGEPATSEMFEPHLNSFIEITAIPRFDENKRLIGLIHIVRDITGRKKTEERIQGQIQKLSALRSIDLAISSSLDLRVTLKVFIEEVVTQLAVDAVNVLLLAPRSEVLEYAASQGFRTSALKHTRVRLGEGYAGVAALENRIVSVPDLKVEDNVFARLDLIKGEDFVSYYGVPLVAKGQVKGVLEIFHRSPLNPDEEWFEFLDSLSLQAAIAIDNNSLFLDLQRSNVELSLAYDNTIEGWSRALDYRDQETEGHSRRVSELTLLIARQFWMSEAELVHVRRGALLHDIGKMGIPDRVLLKPGPLTDEEWKIMRQHPVYSYDLLHPIAYLRPSLDIPYCHHEKWDGTGYPRGLKGEQIPLSARIFAVVDVWDALLSDRPYRPAWTEDRVREHISSNAGSHFDPQVVDVFLKMQLKGH